MISHPRIPLPSAFSLGNSKEKKKARENLDKVKILIFNRVDKNLCLQGGAHGGHARRVSHVEARIGVPVPDPKTPVKVVRFVRSLDL